MISISTNLPPTGYTELMAGKWIAALALCGLMGWGLTGGSDVPLLIVLIVGGTYLVIGLLRNLLRGEFGSDLLAGVSIATSVVLGEYLAGTIVVLMLSGGQALEEFAVERASSVLRALAKRVPTIAHRRRDGVLEDVPVASIEVGDVVLIHPHEFCPVDGIVLEGKGTMDESYMTGEPFLLPKTPGSQALSGAVNGDSLLAIRATARAVDSRYTQVMEVMRESAQRRPRLRRLGDQLGALYTPVALVIAGLAWLLSGEPVRFLAVLVVATPCPLLIAIPVAIMGTISRCARRGILVRNPAILEQLDTIRTLIMDKTGTLTCGEPELNDGYERADILRLAASLERYSRHPLAAAVVRKATELGLTLADVSEMHEPPGQGLEGVVEGRHVRLTGRSKAGRELAETEGLECVVLVDGELAAHYRFRDRPRAESGPFVRHLSPKHQIRKLMILSGDRESEVRWLGDLVGVEEIHAQQSPEEKLAKVRAETAQAPTLYLGDGINDGPALLAATVGVALGQNSEITREAADAVVMESSLGRVDELLHLGHRLRVVALQSAIGGMALSLLGMGAAAMGWLPPVAGALAQEVIDLAAILNALRTVLPMRSATDF